MKNKLIQSPLAAIVLGVCSLMAPSYAVGAASADVCAKELLLSYFPENFVTETLKKFNVPQDKWDAITKDLASKDKDVVKEVEDKASKLNPNPLKDRSPEQRQVAVKIFRESLLNVFGGVLKANGITNDNQIQAMLADIQQQKAKNFAQCMEKQKEQFEKEKGLPEENAPSTLPATPVPAKPGSAPAEENPSEDSLSDADEGTDKDADKDNNNNDSKNDQDNSNANQNNESKTELSDASNTDNANSNADSNSNDTDKDSDTSRDSSNEDK